MTHPHPLHSSPSSFLNHKTKKNSGNDAVLWFASTDRGQALLFCFCEGPFCSQKGVQIVWTKPLGVCWRESPCFDGLPFFCMWRFPKRPCMLRQRQMHLSGKLLSSLLELTPPSANAFCMYPSNRFDKEAHEWLI